MCANLWQWLPQLHWHTMDCLPSAKPSKFENLSILCRCDYVYQLLSTICLRPVPRCTNSRPEARLTICKCNIFLILFILKINIHWIDHLSQASTDRYNTSVKRCSIRQLSDDQKLDFLEGLRRIQQLPISSIYSFWTIAGFHGLPFVPHGKSDEKQKSWGGWCAHGNVLFPTWHR